MSTKYCLNTKTGEIFPYEVSGGLTDFPRGTFLAYGDYLVTGMKSRKEAEEAKKKHIACLNCEGSAWKDEGNPNICGRCGEKLEGEK